MAEHMNTAEALQLVADESVGRPVPDILRVLRLIVRLDVESRATELAACVRVGPLRFYTPFERDDWSFTKRDVEGRDIIHITVAKPIHTLLKAMWRMACRWIKAPGVGARKSEG